MIGWLIALYRPWVSGVVVVAHPTTSDASRGVVQSYDLPSEVVVQAEPTGMLDAVLLGCVAVARWSPERVWINWCDQIAVHPDTVARLADQEGESSVALPLVTRDSPYIHFDRAADGRIVAVRQRREGHVMPERGDSDMGLFSLSADAAMADLPAFATEATPDAGTGERNFLPFIPLAAARGSVVTIPATEDIEAVGVNTPEELARVEAHLKSR